MWRDHVNTRAIGVFFGVVVVLMIFDIQPTTHAIEIVSHY
jgi:tetrahydromethanopterin S-methyltransferase subunit G